MHDLRKLINDRDCTVCRKTKEEDLALIKLKNPIENLTENTISSRLMKIGKATLPWKGYRANGQFTP